MQFAPGLQMEDGNALTKLQFCLFLHYNVCHQITQCEQAKFLYWPDCSWQQQSGDKITILFVVAF